jgi:hypothetical protein
MMPTVYIKNGLEIAARSFEEVDSACEQVLIQRDNYTKDLIASLLCESRALRPADRDYGDWCAKFNNFGVSQQTLWNWRTEYEKVNEIKYIERSQATCDQTKPLINNENLYVFKPDDLPKIARQKYDQLTDANKQAVADKAKAIGSRPQQRIIEGILSDQQNTLRKEGGKPLKAPKPIDASVANEAAKELLDERINQLPAKSQKVVHEILTEYTECLRKDVKEATDDAFKQREEKLNAREEKLNVLDANLNRQRAQLYLVVDEVDLKLLRSFCHPDKYQDKETQDKAHKAQLIVQKLMDTYDRGILRDQVANEKKRAASRKRWEAMQERAGYR